MGTLSYSHSLVAGTNENINDVQDMFNDARTVINGNIDATNAPLLNAHHASWKNLIYLPVAELNPNTGSETSILGGSATIGQLHGNAWYFDPADHAVTGKTTLLRLRAFYTGASANASTLTFRLKPVTRFDLNGRPDLFGTTLSTVAISVPNTGANGTGLAAAGTEFAAPAAGFLELTGQVTVAALTTINIGCLIQIRFT